MEVRRFPTRMAEAPDLAAIRALLERAFRDDFTDEDWEHSIDGWHVAAMEDGVIVSHASVVRRSIDVGGVTYATGYVEAVATEPTRRGRGLGTAVVRAASELIVHHHEFGALSTGEHRFYERLGWERWRGPTYVRRRDGIVRTPGEDDGIMVLRFGVTAAVDLEAPISCDARAGDHW